MSKPSLPSNDAPVFTLAADNLFPSKARLDRLADIPPSRMFLIKKSLAAFKEKQPGKAIFDASQGDGGASLPGVPREILAQAAEMQIEHGTAYTMPYGTAEFRRAVIEDYWKVDSGLGIGPQNVVATVGGRDALIKAYQAILALGHGCQGDVLLVSRVPWISYNWGAYSVGANTLLAPGHPENAWAYTADGIRESVRFAARAGRRVAALVITSPDNPTGRTLPISEQAALARTALQTGAAFVIFDWIYHYVTDQQPYDLNAMLEQFSPAERQRLIFMDGITKSLGGSNIRNAHLIASQQVIDFITARASHGVFPSFYSIAVAMAAYQQGYRQATRGIVQPTSQSRQVLRAFLDENGFRYIMGQGYYAFIEVRPWLERVGWQDTAPLGEYLAKEHGLAVVPGAFVSPFGKDWIRFSYAQPPERTLAAAQRLLEGLHALQDAAG